jgi:hypothetical protein
MDRFKALPLGRQLIIGGGVLLFIDTFLPWQKVSFLSSSVSATAWHGFWGVLLGLLTIAIVVWVGAHVLGVELPVNLPDGLVTLSLGGLILLFALVKTFTEDFSAWASYLGIVLAAAVAAGAWQVFQASGETLPSMPSTAGRDTSVASTGLEASADAEQAPESPASSDPA